MNKTEIQKQLNTVIQKILNNHEIFIEFLVDWDIAQVKIRTRNNGYYIADHGIYISIPLNDDLLKEFNSIKIIKQEIEEKEIKLK